MVFWFLKEVSSRFRKTYSMAALILWGDGKSFGKCRTQLWSRGEQICSKSYGISTIFKKSSCWRCFFVTRRGSFRSVVSELRFGLIGAFSQGKTSSWLVPWGFGVTSKKPRLSWAKSAALKADGPMDWKKTGRCSGWIWLQLGMLQRFTDETKTFQIHSNWWCFCFWRAIDDEECLAFQEHKKTRLCHPLAGICWDWRKQQLQKQFTSFQLNMTISWWICSNSEIPLWTFPIEPFSPPRQTCFDFTRAPWAGGIKMFQMLRWNCSKLKVAQTTSTGCLGSGRGPWNTWQSSYSSSYIICLHPF